MMNIEKELKEMDFSPLSKVKDSLLKDLMLERAARNPNAGRFELDEDQLDFLAAAGNSNFKKTDDDQND